MLILNKIIAIATNYLTAGVGSGNKNRKEEESFVLFYPNCLPEAGLYGRRVDKLGGLKVATLEVKHERFKLEQNAAWPLRPTVQAEMYNT